MNGRSGCTCGWAPRRFCEIHHNWWSRYRVEVERLAKACDTHGPHRDCTYCRIEI